MKTWNVTSGPYRLVFTYIKKDAARIFREHLFPAAYNSYTGAPLFQSAVVAELRESKRDPATGLKLERALAFGVAFCSTKDRPSIVKGVTVALRYCLEAEKTNPTPLSSLERERVATAALRWLKQLAPRTHFALVRKVPGALGRRGWRLVKEV